MIDVANKGRGYRVEDIVSCLTPKSYPLNPEVNGVNA